MKSSIIVCLVLSLFLNGCVLVKRAIYPQPHIAIVSPPPSPLLEVAIPFSKGVVSGWLNQSEPSTDSTPVVLYFHGNGENLQTLLQNRVFAHFAKMKVHCLAVDFPGYGASTGTTSEETVIESAESTYVWLGKKYPQNPRYIAGFSMGAAVAVQLGVKYSSSLKGVILITPWTSMDSVAVNHYPQWLVSSALKDHYNSLSIVDNVETPVLILHGDMDQIIPAAQGKKMADACPQLKKYQIVKGATHQTIMLYEKLWDEIEQFIAMPEIDM